MPRWRCQNWQSAAPPAMVPSRKGLISITFFTVCEAAQAPQPQAEPSQKVTCTIQMSLLSHELLGLHRGRLTMQSQQLAAGRLRLSGQVVTSNVCSNSSMKATHKPVGPSGLMQGAYM